MSSFHDDPDLPEIPLTGGQITGGVVRIGDSVRRPRTEASAFVAELLGMLREKGFEGAPVYLGIDAKGRDCFSHIAGEVDGKWHFYPDETVAAFGKLLRVFHDATRGSALAGDGRVICHHDAGPHNTVFQDGKPVALIDFDMTEPGDEIEDLAYAAWSWCISSNPARPAVEAQAEQVRLLAEAYGLDAVKRRALPEAIVERIAKNVLFWEERREAERADLEQCGKMIEWSERERDFVRRDVEVFAGALAS